MSKRFICIFVTSMFFLLTNLAYGGTESEYVEGQIVEKYKKGLSQRSKGMIHNQTGCTKIKAVVAVVHVL